MKKITMAVLVSLIIIIVACGKKTEHDHEDGSHTHADGTQHANHPDSVAQEEFKVDSTHHRADSTEHSHSHN